MKKTGFFLFFFFLGGVGGSGQLGHCNNHREILGVDSVSDSGREVGGGDGGGGTC